MRLPGPEDNAGRQLMQLPGSEDNAAWQLMQLLCLVKGGVVGAGKSLAVLGPPVVPEIGLIQRRTARR